MLAVRYDAEETTIRARRTEEMDDDDGIDSKEAPLVTNLGFMSSEYYRPPCLASHGPDDDISES